MALPPIADGPALPSYSEVVEGWDWNAAERLLTVRIRKGDAVATVVFTDATEGPARAPDGGLVYDWVRFVD